MIDNLSGKKTLSIGEAAKFLGVSIETLRRWDRKGTLKAFRTKGNQRRYSQASLEAFKVAERVPEGSFTISQAASYIGVHPETLRRWEKEGALTPKRTNGNQRRYTREELDRVREITPPPPPEPAPEAVERGAVEQPLQVKVRTLEDYQPSPPIRYRFVRSFVTLTSVLLFLGILWSIIPPLAKVRVNRFFTFSPLNPIVDVNDVFEYAQIDAEDGTTWLKPKLPLLVDVLQVVDAKISGTSRFLGKVFFGAGDGYYITPLADASLRSLVLSHGARIGGDLTVEGEITTESIDVEEISLNGVNIEEAGLGGGEADSIAWGNITGQPNIVSSVDGVVNDEGNIDLVAGSNITITPNDGANTITISSGGPGSGFNADTLDSLDSLQFLRSDASDNYTSGTLTLDAGTTFNILSTWQIGGTAVTSTAVELNLLDGEVDVGLSILTDANIPNNLTLDATANINAAALTSGTVPTARLSGAYTGITGVGTLTQGTWSANTITVSYGGTGATSLTDHGVLVGSGTGAVTVLAVGTNNQLLIGQTGADPAWGTIGAASITANSLDFSEFVNAMTVDATTTVNLYSGAADVDLQFYNSDSSDELLFLDGSAARIGIGTTSPGTRLEIVDANRVPSGQAVLDIRQDDDSVHGLNIGNDTADSQNGRGMRLRVRDNGDAQIDVFVSAAQQDLLLLPSGGNVSIGTTSPGQKLDVEGEIELANYLYFANGSSEYLRWDGSSFIFTDDLLPSADNTYDLGSASYRWQDLHLGPSSLHIYSTAGTGGAGSDYTMGDISFSGDAFNIVTSNAGSGIGGQINLTSAYPAGNTTSSAFNFTTSTDLGASDEALQIGDSASTFMTVMGDGDVGIGTTDPTALLHVTGSPSDYIAKFYNTSTNADADGLYLSVNADGATGLYLYDDYADSRIAEFSTVSFESDVPASFNAQGDVAIANDLLFTNLDAAYIRSDSHLYISAGSTNENENLYLRSAGGGDVIIGSDSTYFKSSGDVGIGATDPSSKLHVSGGAASVDVLIEADTDNSGEGDQPSLTFSQDGGAVTGKLGYFDSSNDLSLYNVYAANLTLGAGGTKNHVVILSGGNVGIGTTDPSSKLEVSGNMEISGYIQQDNWSTPTFANGWTDYGGGWATAGYYLDKNCSVRLKGLIKSGTIGAAAFTLPSGYRPGEPELMSSHSNSGACRVDVSNSGTVVPNNPCTNGWVTLSGITFRATGCAGGADLAEHYPSTDADSIETGDVVSIDPQQPGHIMETKQAYDSKVIGIIATHPGMVLGEEINDGQLATRTVALSGRVPAKVTTKDGPIRIGDRLTSSTTAGFAAKATRAGDTIGKPLEPFDPAAEGLSCLQVSSIDAIVWPADPDGKNSARPCFKLPDGTYVGKTMTFVDLDWYDPRLVVDGSGDLAQGLVADGRESVVGSQGAMVDEDQRQESQKIEVDTAALSLSTQIVKDGGTQIQQAGTDGADEVEATEEADVSFSAHRDGVNLPISSEAWEKIQLTAEEFDTSDDFAESRFTPTVAGKYVLTGAVRVLSLGDRDYCMAGIFKNGALYKQGRAAYRGEEGECQSTISAVVDANGSADYFELHAYHTHSSDRDVAGDVGSTYFTGSQLRGADLAEYYPASEKDLKEGDIVVVDGPALGRVKRSDESYQKAVGVITSDPAMILGMRLGPNSVVVGLAGKVPIKVSDANGPIEIGDSLSTSSLPGIGMRGVEAGYAIAQTLEEFDPAILDCRSVDSLEAIDWPGWLTDDTCFELPDGTHVGLVLSFIRKGYNGSNEPLASEGSLDPFGEKELEVAGDFRVLGRSVLGSTIVAGELVVDAVVTIDTFGIQAFGPTSTLRLQPKGLGGVDILAGKVIIDEEGNLTVKGTVTAEKFAVTGDSAGKAEIGAGRGSTTVKSSRVSKASLVFITPITPTNNKVLYIGDQVDGEFRVEINSPIGKDIEFNWWVIN